MTNYSPSVQQLMNCRSQTKRSNSCQPVDIAAVQALTQAAINVELFTIPLYMTSMYSIQGMHQITGKNDFYTGRLWPGAAPVAEPNKIVKAMSEAVDNNNPCNKKAFNSIFSVFIQEMLHLQLAANIHCALNENNSDSRPDGFEPQDPTFTSKELQNDKIIDGQTYPHAWTCYGDNITTIPHIIDLTDIKDDAKFSLDESYANQPLSERVIGQEINKVKVKLSELNDNAVTLFMAIEASEELLKSVIKSECMYKYFPIVPFNGWDQNWDGTADSLQLPMFGSIAHMYTCLAEYLNIRYEDGNTLMELVFNANPVQQDLFNYSNRKGGKGSAGHPCAEFPAMGELQVTAADPETAKLQIFNIISGITDQGEGGILNVSPNGHAVVIDPKEDEGVKKRYQPDYQALSADYPTYDENGNKEALSADAVARSNGGEIDHFDRFRKVASYLKSGHLTTWVDWHNDPKNNEWTAELLTTETYDPEVAALKAIPTPSAVAKAMNNLKTKDGDKNYKMFSHVAAGSIAGITTVLNTYWSQENFFCDPIDFPYPSMSGSGDRISICWAIFGKVPDLELGAFERHRGGWQEGLDAPANHACQGLSFASPGHDGSAPEASDHGCATLGVFHTCKGSNDCAGEGGCGYVHDATVGGGGCGGSNPSGKGSGLFSAPGDNQCAGFGGCAVPISASQLFPSSGQKKMEMQLFNLKDKDYTPIEGSMEYKIGDNVHDVAWDAYTEVLKKNGYKECDLPEKPEPSDLRLAFPPST